MRGSAIKLAFALTVAVLLVSACDGGDEDGDSGDGQTTVAAIDQPASPVAKQFSGEDTSETVYEGTMSIAVDYYDYCQGGETQLIGSETYEMPVQVVRGPPAEAEGIRESSPFNLIVGANPSNEAGITTISATVATAPADDSLVLFEYWKMSVQGSRVQGELANTWGDAGLAGNIFPTDQLVPPCVPEIGLLVRSIVPIEEGALMEGSITDDSAELTITGGTADPRRRFVAEVTATRRS
jgi:hypothetical protein